MNDAMAATYYSQEVDALRRELSPFRTLFNILVEHMDDPEYDWRRPVRRAMRAVERMDAERGQDTSLGTEL